MFEYCIKFDQHNNDVFFDWNVEARIWMNKKKIFYGQLDCLQRYVNKISC